MSPAKGGVHKLQIFCREKYIQISSENLSKGGVHEKNKSTHSILWKGVEFSASRIHIKGGNQICCDKACIEISPEYRNRKPIKFAVAKYASKLLLNTEQATQ